MDYSHPAYFNAQPYQFMGIPPLTPSHSNSAPSEEFNTTSPPLGAPLLLISRLQPASPSPLHDYQALGKRDRAPQASAGPVHVEPHPAYGRADTPLTQEIFGDLPNDQFQGFDQYAPFNAQHQAFPNPPTPPNQHHAGHAAQHQVQPALNGAASVGQNVALKAQPPSMDGLPSAQADPSSLDNGQRAGSNSDDDDLTPAQSRRKAQNRAAQRAFRERKERHVKDLEAKLATLEASQQETVSENERLKRDLQKVNTENEILRATSSMAAAVSPGAGHGIHATTTGPLTYCPTDFYDDLLQNHDNKTPSHRVAYSENGQRLLGAGAAWDIIISHDLFKRGLVDITDVSNRLKSQAKCDGQGPVFEERAVIAAVEQSVASGSDELL